MRYEGTINKAIKFTYRDYLHLPEEKRYEIIDGELFMVPSPDRNHQRTFGDLGLFLRDFVKKMDLGEVYFAPFDVVLSKTDVVQPDIMFISKERLGIITKKNVRGAPDLLVEILSLKRYKDRVIKRRLYARYGVKEYWIVDPKRGEVEVFVLGEKGFKSLRVYRKGDQLESPLLKGLKIDLMEVFGVFPN